MRGLDQRWGFHPQRQRTEDAIAHREIESIDQLLTELNRRGSGRQVRDVFWRIQTLLEPSSCQMAHCESHTAMAFCNCAKGKVASRCAKHRAYLRRRRQREAARLGDADLSAEKAEGTEE